LLPSFKRPERPEPSDFFDAWCAFAQTGASGPPLATGEAGRSFGALPFAFPGIPSVRCLFTTAHANNLSGVAETTVDGLHCVVRRKQFLCRAFGLRQWAELNQVHKDDFVGVPLTHAPVGAAENSALKAEDGSMAEPPEFAPHASADGQHTAGRRVALVIKTADCQPILLAHRGGGAVAAIHAGWRGNAMNFPGTAVAAFCAEYGFSPQDVLAVRGPSLGPGAAEFVNFDREWPQEFAPWFDRRTQCVNLWELTKYQLQSAGLPSENIFSLDLCTHSLPGLFFSHRRKHTGRQAAIIWMA